MRQFNPTEQTMQAKRLTLSHSATFLGVTLALLSTCARPQSETGVRKDTTTTFALSVDPKLPPFQFYISESLAPVDSAAASYNSMIQMITICIVDSLSRDTIQVITDYPELLGAPAQLPVIEDANFDGYPDISCLETQGVTGNQYFTVWLYDKARHQFVVNDALSQLCNPYFDVHAKQIRTFQKCGGGCYRFATYVVQDDSLAEIAFLNLDPVPSSEGKEIYHCRRGRLVPGKGMEIKEWDFGREVFKLPETSPWFSNENQK